MSREYGPTKVRSEVVIQQHSGPCEVTLREGLYRMMMPETQFLIGLCVRCYLRFKFSSISSFKAELRASPLRYHDSANFGPP